MEGPTGRTIRVLIFGTTGVGKTSLCNIVTQTSTPGRVSDAPRGATFERQEFPSFDADGDSIVLTDTVGLNESDVGRVPGEEALHRLIDLLKKSEQGYNILIHVMKHPARITAIDQKNYEFFVEIIAQKKIPSLLVVTGCENEDPMSEWPNKIDVELDLTYKEIIQKALTEHKDVISTSFQKDGRHSFAEVREESREAVIKAIKANASPEPIKFSTGLQGLLALARRAWNWLVGQAGFERWKILNRRIKNILIAFGLSEEKAEEEAVKY